MAPHRHEITATVPDVSSHHFIAVASLPHRRRVRFPFLHHRSEGNDDLPAHIKAALTQTSIGIPVSAGKALLGTWQGIYLFEHRTSPHRREIVLHLIQ